MNEETALVWSRHLLLTVTELRTATNIEHIHQLVAYYLGLFSENQLLLKLQDGFFIRLWSSANFDGRTRRLSVPRRDGSTLDTALQTLTTQHLSDDGATDLFPGTNVVLIPLAALGIQFGVGCAYRISEIPPLWHLDYFGKDLAAAYLRLDANK